MHGQKHCCPCKINICMTIDKEAFESQRIVMSNSTFIISSSISLKAFSPGHHLLGWCVLLYKLFVPSVIFKAEKATKLKDYKI